MGWEKQRTSLNWTITKSKLVSLPVWIKRGWRKSFLKEIGNRVIILNPKMYSHLNRQKVHTTYSNCQSLARSILVIWLRMPITNQDLIHERKELLLNKFISIRILNRRVHSKTNQVSWTQGRRIQLRLKSKNQQTIKVRTRMLKKQRIIIKARIKGSYDCKILSSFWKVNLKK